MRKERLMEQQVSWRRDMGQTKSSTVPKTTIANARGRNLGYIFQDKKIRLFSKTCLDTLCKPHTSLKSYPSFKPPFDVLKILKKSHQKSKLRQGKKYKTKQKKVSKEIRGCFGFP